MRSTEHAAQPHAATGPGAPLATPLRAKGTGAPSLRLLALLGFALGVLLALPSAALAARGHVLLSEFGAPGSGLGQLSEPFGLAFDEQGHSVYVADHGNNRVQRFSYNAVAKKYEYASQITAATGEGSGTLSEGSKTVTSLSTSAGLFVPNQTIEGPGIPTGEGSGDLSVGSGEGELHLLAKGRGEVTAGSTEITGVSVESGAFAVGESIAAQEGIPLGATIPADATIVSCSPSCASPTALTISKPAEITGHVHLLSGSKEITNLSVSSGAFAVGEEFDPHTVRGGLQRGTTIAACSPSCAAPTSLTVSSGAVDEGPHSLLAASHEVANLNTSSGEFAVGQAISGPGIPVGATITAASPTSLTITALPTEAKTAAPLSAHTTIASVSGSTLTLSSKATQNGSASLSAEQKLSRVAALAVDNGPSSPSHGDLYVTTQIEKESFVATDSFERIRVIEVVVDKFTSSGEFVDQIVSSPSFTGTGDLTAGSNIISNFSTPIPALVQEYGGTVSGPGIPPGTEVHSCTGNLENPSASCGTATSETYLFLSQPVEAGHTASGVTLSFAPRHFSAIDGLAVDPAGSLSLLENHARSLAGHLLEHFDSAAANQFQTACHAEWGAKSPSDGLAVDSHGNLYTRLTGGSRPPGGAPLEADSNCKLLQETIGAEAPDAANGVSFFGLGVETTSNDLYVDNLTSIGRFSPAGVEIERFGSGPMASEGCKESDTPSCLGGLAVDSATSEVLAALGKQGKVVVFGLEPPTLPKLENEGVSQVTNDSAQLEAEVNPRSLGGEAPTTYSFQYGPCSEGPSSCAESPFPATTPPGTLAPSFEVEAASSLLEGLAPGTTYHFRLAAENSHGPVEGEERVFTTFSPGEFALPDARQWEMVSPSDLHGTLIVPLNNSFAGGAPIQSTPGGDAFTFATVGPTESEPAGNDNGTQVFSTRSPGAGWSSHDITVAHLRASTTVSGPGQEARFFSEDLSHAVFQQYGPFFPLSPAASEATPYLYDTAARSFSPLITGCPAEGECPAAVEALADVPAGTVFGTTGELWRPGPNFRGATPDLSHVIIASQAALTETPLPGRQVGLYEWSAAPAPSERLQLVSLLPGTKGPAFSAALGFQSNHDNTRGAISADGSRVFFSGGYQLYMRDTAAQKTVQLDLPEAGCGGCENGSAAKFQLATADGSRAFFTDSSRLTAASGTSSNGREAADLYECQIIEGSGGPECKLTDLTPKTGGEAAAVQGTIAGASTDGSYVYFVANGALAPGAAPARCEPSPAATCNLYVRHAGATTFIAALSGLDSPDWSRGEVTLGTLTARVSPNGNWLAFMSRRPLTGYDNRDASSGRPDEEVFLYEAAHGRLTCASCNPSGARPHGAEFETGAHENLPLSRGARLWEPSSWLAANIPGWTNFETPTAAYQPRYLSDTGRLYFNSTDGLVAKDSNGVGDVYQFEPEGEGNCTPTATNGAVTYRPARPFEAQGQSGEELAGCVGLISSGTSSEESALLDVSASGNDVFFLSSAKLSPLDVEGGRTVYDAHVCAAASPCPPSEAAKPPVCTGDACQQPAEAPNDATPGSLTFHGAGNVKEAPALSCARGRVRRHGKCVKPKAKKHHRARHRRARRNRGGRR